MTNNVIFIGGIHGVGKTYFCNRLSEKLQVKNFSASTLIANKRKNQFTNDKRIDNIASNQDYLCLAIAELGIGKEWFLLDGHFCLLDKNGNVSRIPKETFVNLDPKMIVVLIDAIDNISARLKLRDNANYDLELLKQFQEEEVAYANEIAQILDIPIVVHKVNDNLAEVVSVVKNFAEI